MKKQKTCDLNVKVIYDLDIKLQYFKYSDFQVGRDKISHDRKYFLDLEPRTWKWNLLKILSYPQMCEVILKSTEKI